MCNNEDMSFKSPNDFTDPYVKRLREKCEKIISDSISDQGEPVLKSGIYIHISEDEEDYAKYVKEEAEDQGWEVEIQEKEVDTDACMVFRKARER